MQRSSLNLCAVLALAGLASSGYAQTDVTFTNIAGGLWSNSGNWTPASVPNNGGGFTFNATLGPLGLSYTVDMDIPVTIENFTMNEALATLDIGSQTMTVNLDFTADVGLITSSGGGGTIVVAGETVFGDVQMVSAGTVQSTGSLKIISPTLLDICDTDVDYGGTGMQAATWQGNNTMLLNFGSTFTNSSVSTMEISPDGNKLLAGDGSGSLNNDGELIMLASPLPVMAGPDSQTLAVGSKGIGSKSQGANAAVNDSFTIDAAGFVNAGGVRVDRGDFDLTGVVNDQTVDGELNLGRWTLRTTAANGGLSRIFFPTRDAVSNINTRVTLLGQGALFPAIDGVDLIGAAGRFEIGELRNFSVLQTLTNLGELVVGQGSVFDSSGGLTNLSAGQLSGGAYTVSGTLLVQPFDNVLVLNGAQVRMIGVGSQFPALGTLQTIGNGAMLSLENGRGFVTQNSMHVQPGGVLRIGTSSTMSVTGALVNANSGALTGGAFEIAGMLTGGIGQISAMVNNRLAFVGPNSQVIDGAGTDVIASLQFVDANSTLEVHSGKILVTNAPITVDGTLIIDPSFTVNPVPGGVMAGATEFETLGMLTINPGATVEIGVNSLAADGVGLIRADSVVFAGGSAGKLVCRFGVGIQEPAYPLSVHVVRSTSVAGQFATVEAIGLGANLVLTVVYDGLTGILIQVVPVCPADLNNDGFVDSGDISAFISLFLAGDSAADLNNDGFIDSGDISTFVVFFLAGC